MKFYMISAIRILLGFVFVVSGIAKFSNLPAFATTIKNFGFVPDVFAGTVAMVIPSFECVAGLLLLLGIWTKISSGVVIGLLIVFIAAIIPNLAFGSEIECGCFGPLSQSKVGVGLLIRDVIMLALTLIIFTQEIHKISLDNLITNRRS